MLQNFAIPLPERICDIALSLMSVTLAPGASLRRIAEIVRNAVLFGPDAWEGRLLPERKAIPSPRQNILPTDRDVVELFTLLGSAASLTCSWAASPCSATSKGATPKTSNSLCLSPP